jgi:Domain of unknown function (DUF222)
VWLGFVADVDSREGVVARARAGCTGTTLLRHTLFRTHAQAKADVRAARMLARDADPRQGGLPRLGAAFRAGRVSREHVDVACRTREHIPSHYYWQPLTGWQGQDYRDLGLDPAEFTGRELCGGEAIDALLTHLFPRFTTWEAHQLAQRLIAAIDPDGANTFDPDAHERRQVTFTRDRTGMIVGRFSLGPAEGEVFTTALTHFSGPDPTREEVTEDGDTVLVADRRTAAQRRADGLATISRLAMGAAAAGTAGGQPPHVLIHAHPDQIADLLYTGQPQTTSHPQTTGPDASDEESTGDASIGEESTDEEAIGEEAATAERSGGRGSTAWGAYFDERGRWIPRRTGSIAQTGQGTLLPDPLLNRFLCDAILQAVLLSDSGAPLRLGRRVRLATSAQRKALIARDRGCVIPGCGAPAAWTEAHHVHYWSRGGPTDIDAMCLLCSRHHTEVHLGIWVIQIRDGIPWIQLPHWVDKQRRWARNTYPHDSDLTRRLGTQLRLNLPEPHTKRRARHPESADPNQGGDATRGGAARGAQAPADQAPADQAPADQAPADQARCAHEDRDRDDDVA